jgi:hypothetical protein
LEKLQVRKGGGGSLADTHSATPTNNRDAGSQSSVGRLGGTLTSVLLVFPCASDYTKLICRYRASTVLVASKYFKEVIELPYGLDLR